MVTDRQVRRLLKLIMTETTLSAAAAKAVELDDDDGGSEIPPKGGGDPIIDKTVPGGDDTSNWKGNMLTIESLQEDGSWELVAEIPPRARPTGPVYFSLADHLQAGKDLTLKYS